jgi:hypothetical protein
MRFFWPMRAPVQQLVPRACFSREHICAFSLLSTHPMRTCSAPCYALASLCDDLIVASTDSFNYLHGGHASSPPPSSSYPPTSISSPLPFPCTTSCTCIAFPFRLVVALPHLQLHRLARTRAGSMWRCRAPRRGAIRDD